MWFKIEQPDFNSVWHAYWKEEKAFETEPKHVWHCIGLAKTKFGAKRLCNKYKKFIKLKKLGQLREEFDI